MPSQSDAPEGTQKTKAASSATFSSLKMARLASTMIKNRSGNSKYMSMAPQLTTVMAPYTTAPQAVSVIANAGITRP